MAEDGDEDDELAVVGRLPDAHVCLAVAQTIQDPRRNPDEQHDDPKQTELKTRSFWSHGLNIYIVHLFSKPITLSLEHLDLRDHLRSDV